MRAAVGTAVAAAVWTSPHIEGFSLVPDYASAATSGGGGNGGPPPPSVCAVTSDSVTGTKNSAAKACNQAGVITRKICWGNAVCSGPGANQGTATCGTFSGSLPALPKPAGGSLNLAYSAAGSVYNGNQANMEGIGANSKLSGLSLAGIDANVNTCTLDVTGACSTGSFRAGLSSSALGGSSSETRGANGAFGDVWVKCQATAVNSSQSASFTLTLTCGFNC